MTVSEKVFNVKLVCTQRSAGKYSLKVVKTESLYESLQGYESLNEFCLKMRQFYTYKMFCRNSHPQ